MVRALPRIVPKAFDLYKRALDGGYIAAAFKLGYEYFDGKVVAQDYAKACELFQLVADGENDIFEYIEYYSSVVNNLAYMYAHGRGVVQDSSKASGLYQRAMDAGEQYATVNVANMLMEGGGIV